MLILTYLEIFLLICFFYFLVRISLDLVGAECIVEDDRGNIYTGLKNGQIMKIHRSRKDKVGEGRQELLLTSRFPGLVSTDPSATHGQPLGELGLAFNYNNSFVMKNFVVKS